MYPYSKKLLLMKQCGGTKKKKKYCCRVHFIFSPMLSHTLNLSLYDCYTHCWPMLITYRWVLFPFLDDYLSWCVVLCCWRMMAELSADLDDLDVQMVVVAAVLRDCWSALHRAQNAWLDYLTDNTKNVFEYKYQITIRKQMKAYQKWKWNR